MSGYEPQRLREDILVFVVAALVDALVEVFVVALGIVVRVIRGGVGVEEEVVV
jgi:hypothetical protein